MLSLPLIIETSCSNDIIQSVKENLLKLKDSTDLLIYECPKLTIDKSRDIVKECQKHYHKNRLIIINIGELSNKAQEPLLKLFESAIDGIKIYILVANKYILSDVLRSRCISKKFYDAETELLYFLNNRKIDVSFKINDLTNIDVKNIAKSIKHDRLRDILPDELMDFIW